MDYESGFVEDKVTSDIMPIQFVKVECSEDVAPEFQQVKLELPVDTRPVLSVKEEWSEFNEETDVDHDMMSLKVEPKDEITLEDHCISLAEGSIGSATWSPAENILGTCTEKVPSHSLPFTRIYQHYKSPLSIIEDHITEEKCKENEGIIVQQAIDDPSSDTALYKQVKINSILPDNVIDHTIKEVKKCMKCGKQLNEGHKHTCDLKILKAHMCEECGVCFAHLRTLREHLKIHSGEKDHKCVQCGKCFTQASTLRIHLEVHSGVKKHKCVECGKSFNNSNYLRMHLKIHSGEKVHKCEECGKCFTLATHLRTHLKFSSRKNEYKCVECGKSFSQACALRIHLRVHSDVKNHKCVECGKSFKKSSHLRMHLNIHSAEKDYNCAQCEKCFCRRGDLIRHLKTHTSEKNHICVNCGKRFSDGRYLRQHLKIHSYEHSSI